jgi:hypothetical protein
MKRIGMLALGAVALIGVSESALGATVDVDVYAEVKWETLTFTFTPDEGVDYSEGDDFFAWLPYDAHSGVSVMAGHIVGFDDSTEVYEAWNSNMDPDTHDIVNPHNGWYAGSLSADAVGAESTAGSLEGPGGGPYALATIDIAGPDIWEVAEASALRSGLFEVMLPGTLSISMDYLQSGSVYATGGGWGSYNSLVEVVFVNIDSTHGADFDIISEWLDRDPGLAAATWTSEGLHFDAGDRGAVEALALVEAEGRTPPVVPEPISLVLMLSGLGALVVRRYGSRH